MFFVPDIEKGSGSAGILSSIIMTGYLDVIERENELSGYFCIITSEKMTAKDAIKLYKSRDASEKLFRGDKSYLGDKSLRIYGDSSADSKIFIEFIG